jgi:hypothetical protein
MKLFSTLLACLLLAVASKAQQLSRKFLNPDSSGTYYSIGQFLENDSVLFYALYPTQSDDEYEYNNLFLSYEFICEDSERGGTVMVLSGVDHIETSTMAINLDYGQAIVDSRSDQQIQFIEEYNVFLVNKEDIADQIIDLKGNVLYESFEYPIRYCSIGFYQERQWKDPQGHQSFFDSKGSELQRFENFMMRTEIDSDNFLGQRMADCYGDSVLSSIILNSSGEIAFDGGMGCSYIRLRKSCETCGTEILGDNLVYFDESETILIKDAKGNWQTPIEKFHRKNYVTYVKDLTKGTKPLPSFKGKKVYYYAIADGDMSYLLSNKGKIILALDKPIEAVEVRIDNDFVFVYDGDNTYMLFDKKGLNIYEVVLDTEVKIPFAKTHRAFKAADEKSIIYIDKETGKLFSVAADITQPNSLEELEILMKQGTVKID